MQALKRILVNPISSFILIGIIAILLLIKHNDNNPFTIPLVNQQGQTVTLSQYLGKKFILINFWASWCQHCQQEVAILNQLAEKYPQLQIIAIQIDDNVADPIFNTTKYIILHATINGNIIINQFGNNMGAVPYMVLLDPTGKVINSIVGEASLIELKRTLTTNIKPKE